MLAASMWDRIEAHLGSEQVSRVIYGAIIGMAVIVVFEHHPTGAWATEATLIATAAAVALAELYSEVIGTTTKLRKRVEAHHLRHIAGDVSAVAFGIWFPGFYFFFAGIGWMEMDTAFTLAKWTGVGLITGYGYAAGRLSGSSRVSSLLQALAVGLIAIALIGFKALVH